MEMVEGKVPHAEFYNSKKGLRYEYSPLQMPLWLVIPSDSACAPLEARTEGSTLKIHANLFFFFLSRISLIVSELRKGIH